MNNDLPSNGQNKLSLVLGVFLLLIFLAVILWLIIFVFNNIPKLDAIVIVALITSVVSMVGIFVSKAIESNQKRKQYLYGKREEPYIEIIDLIYKQVYSIKSGNYPEDKMLSDLRNISQKLTIWGSDEVIKKWHNFIKCAKTSPGISFLKLEDVLFAIRKDMGLNNKALDKGDLLRFFVNDIDEYIH